MVSSTVLTIRSHEIVLALSTIQCAAGRLAPAIEVGKENVFDNSVSFSSLSKTEPVTTKFWINKKKKDTSTSQAIIEKTT